MTSLFMSISVSRTSHLKTLECQYSSHLSAFQEENKINTFPSCQGRERLSFSPVCLVFSTCQVGMWEKSLGDPNLCETLQV